MSQTLITYQFKNLLPTLEDFKTFISTYTNCDSNDLLMPFVYQLLLQEYANADVMYDRTNAFYRHFGNTMSDLFNQYKFRQRIIQEQYALTGEDIVIMNEVITNLANNPNSQTSDPKVVLDYISNQNYSLAKEGKFKKYIEAIYSCTNQLYQEFIDNFSKHFIKLIPNTIWVY